MWLAWIANLGINSGEEVGYELTQRLRTLCTRVMGLPGEMGTVLVVMQT